MFYAICLDVWLEHKYRLVYLYINDCNSHVTQNIPRFKFNDKQINKR